MDGNGLSSVHHNLSLSFNRLCQGLASHIYRSSAQTQQHTDMVVDSNILSPNTMRSQLSAYQQTVKELHLQSHRVCVYREAGLKGYWFNQIPGCCSFNICCIIAVRVSMFMTITILLKVSLKPRSIDHN